MSDVRQAMMLIGGVEPTPQQIQRVQAIAHSLGIANNDPMMAILIALDCYHGAFKELPAKAQTAATEAAAMAERMVKLHLEQVIAESIREITPQAGKAMANVAQEVARNTSEKQMWQWLAGCIAVAFVSLSLSTWYAHSRGNSSGYQAGYGAGYTEAKDEKAAAAWANTPEGKTAYRFAQSGELQRLARCQGKGWKVEKGKLCYPYPVSAKEGVYGWAMP